LKVPKEEKKVVAPRVPDPSRFGWRKNPKRSHHDEENARGSESSRRGRSRLDTWDLLVLYVDGIQFGVHHVLAAVGVDTDGQKHVLGIREGASENTQVARALLEELVERGLDPERRRLFVIDGSKALRKAIDQVFEQDCWICHRDGHSRAVERDRRG
jgi:hypothetical protein